MQHHRVRARFCEYIDTSAITRKHACRRYHAQARMKTLSRASTHAGAITRKHAGSRCHVQARKQALSRTSTHADHEHTVTAYRYETLQHRYAALTRYTYHFVLQFNSSAYYKCVGTLMACYARHAHTHVCTHSLTHTCTHTP